MSVIDTLTKQEQTVKSFNPNFKSHQKAVTLSLDVNLTTK